MTESQLGTARSPSPGRIMDCRRWTQQYSESRHRDFRAPLCCHMHWPAICVILKHIELIAFGKAADTIDPDRNNSFLERRKEKPSSSRANPQCADTVGVMCCATQFKLYHIPSCQTCWCINLGSALEFRTSFTLPVVSCNVQFSCR